MLLYIILFLVLEIAASSQGHRRPCRSADYIKYLDMADANVETCRLEASLTTYANTLQQYFKPRNIKVKDSPVLGLVACGLLTADLLPRCNGLTYERFTAKDLGFRYNTLADRLAKQIKPRRGKEVDVRIGCSYGVDTTVCVTAWITKNGQGECEKNAKKGQASADTEGANRSDQPKGQGELEPQPEDKTSPEQPEGSDQAEPQSNVHNRGDPSIAENGSDRNSTFSEQTPGETESTLNQRPGFGAQDRGEENSQSEIAQEAA